MQPEKITNKCTIIDPNWVHFGEPENNIRTVKVPGPEVQEQKRKASCELDWQSLNKKRKLGNVLTEDVSISRDSADSDEELIKNITTIYKKSEAVYEYNKNQHMACQNLLGAAYESYEKKDYLKAETIAQEGLKLGDGITDFQKFDLLRILSLSYANQRKFYALQKIARTGLDIGSNVQKLFFYPLFVQACFELKDYRSGQEGAQKALSLPECTSLKGQIYLDIANAFFEEGDYVNAEKNAQTLLRLPESTNLQKFLGGSLLMLIYFNEGKYIGAMKAAENALELPKCAEVSQLPLFHILYYIYSLRKDYLGMQRVVEIVIESAECTKQKEVQLLVDFAAECLEGKKNPDTEKAIQKVFSIPEYTHSNTISLIEKLAVLSEDCYKMRLLRSVRKVAKLGLVERGCTDNLKIKFLKILLMVNLDEKSLIEAVDIILRILTFINDDANKKDLCHQSSVTFISNQVIVNKLYEISKNITDYGVKKAMIDMIWIFS